MIASIKKVDVPPGGVVSGKPTAVTIEYRTEEDDTIGVTGDGTYKITLSSADKPPPMPVQASKDDFKATGYLTITGAPGDCRVTFQLQRGGVPHVNLIKVRAT